MINLHPLTIHASLPSQGRSLFPVGTLALPAAVETAAWAVPVAGELRLLINHPGSGETKQWRVLPTLQVEPLPSLPLVAAGAVGSGRELIVTGADATGQPVVIGVAEKGETAWRFTVPVSSPTRWPVPGCAPRSAIVWQASADKLETADVGPEGIKNRRAFPVGGPPLEVALGDDALWAAWHTSKGIQGIKVKSREVRSIHLAISSPGSLAVGVCDKGACLAWTLSKRAFFSWIDEGGGLLGDPLELELARTANGTLAIVPGLEPLVWAQFGEVREGELPRWESALVVPGDSPLTIEGLIHSVAWWGETVIVVGTAEIQLLKRHKGPIGAKQ